MRTRQDMYITTHARARAQLHMYDLQFVPHTCIYTHTHTLDIYTHTYKIENEIEKDQRARECGANGYTYVHAHETVLQKAEQHRKAEETEED